jgi:hypothetical protein
MNGHATATPEFVQQFDEVPAFWQYLQGLSPDDLIIELVQNEFDALSTHTRIVFHPDKFICEGNGIPVDADGWTRLTFIRGAGDRAPRKCYQFGVKNHGLKACFTIGDEIQIQSDGKRMIQTLYRNGAGAAPSPGTYPYPVPDATAPKIGCRVVVPYRTTRLRPGTGEVFDFDVPSEESRERLFRQASVHMPERFIGALVPGVREAYTLEIAHHSMGTVIFRFSCSLLKGKRTKPYFRRKCEVSGDLPSRKSGVVLQEECHRWTVRHPEDVDREIPRFYEARNNRFFIEIAWQVTARGVPVSQAGRRRYPIAYALDNDAALTGMGVHISAPYVSDSQRHGAAIQNPFNAYVDQCARKRLIELLKRHIVPKHGAGALCLLYNTNKSAFDLSAEDDPLVPLIDQLINARAVPLADPLSHSRQRNPSRKRPDRTVRFFGPRVDKHGNIRRVLVPVLTWESKISEDLTSLCPVQQDIMHPDVPEPIVARLIQKACKGWATAYVTFDEHDVAQRWMADPKAYFPWDADADWQAEFSDPSRTREYVDIVFRATGNDSLDDAIIEALQGEARVPDSKRVPRPLADLYAGYNLPHNLPLTIDIPVLHPALSTHRLWRKEGWKRTRLTFDEFLQQADMASAPVEHRKLFWEWLAANHGKVPQNTWSRLAALPVWLDHMGELRPIDAFCLPRRKTTRRILEKNLHIPHDRVLPVVKNPKRRALRVRQRPKVDEVERFLKRALDGFPEDRPLTSTERQAFQEVEKLLDKLGRDPDVSDQLEELSDHARGLNAAGALQKPPELVRSDAKTRQLSLLKSDLLTRTPCSLDSLKGWCPSPVPTSAQVIHALRADPQCETALIPRLKALKNARERERSGEPWGIDAIPCIRVGTEFKAPNELAFRSTRGEYWGEWRKSISPSGLSAEVQQLYRLAGVLSGEPTSDTSRVFFEWLKGQSSQVKARHTSYVLRHWLHKEGPSQWAKNRPSMHVVPIEDSGGMDLVNITTMQKDRNVFIPDHTAAAEAIRKSGHTSRAKLAIHWQPDVSQPITEQLRAVGVLSLREAIVNPVQVLCAASRPAGGEVYQALKTLQTCRMKRELRKRLDELDVPSSQLRENWSDRVGRICEVKVARELKATFRICTQQYEFKVDATIEESTNEARGSVIWIGEESDSPQNKFFEAMTELLFDRPDRGRPILLREAVQREFTEHGPSWGTPVKEDEEPPESAEIDGFGATEEAEMQDPLGETRRTHGKGKRESSAGVPNPGTIPTESRGTSNFRARGSRQAPRTNSEPRRRASKHQGPEAGRSIVEEEAMQVEDLKQNQYAWHCQVCLGMSQPAQLAPAQSYAARRLNRQKMVEVHHVDQVHAGGARHAGNLLLLCHHHHDHLGDAMSRQEVARALRIATQGAKRRFWAASGGQRSRIVDGYIASVPLLSRDDSIAIFFTVSHADFWLHKASGEEMETSDGAE